MTFDLAGHPEGAPVVKKMRVAAAGKSADFEFDTSAGRRDELGWVSKTWEFTAIDAMTALEFYSLDAGGNTGPLLDNVAVVAVGKQE